MMRMSVSGRRHRRGLPCLPAGPTMKCANLFTLWPTASATQVTNRVHRPCASVRDKARRLLKGGLLKSKKARRNKIDQGRSTTNSIKPGPQDFDEVKRNYCRKHHVSVAQLSARFESDDQLAAELYRLAQVAKLTRLAAGEENTGRRTRGTRPFLSQRLRLPNMPP